MLNTFIDLDALNVLAAQVVGNMTVLPLSRDEPGETHYFTLDEALAAGAVHVTEVSESGRVPELRFRNDGDLPVLLLDGEELVGAKQNRVLNLTILAPVQSEIAIPVSCVERGRWTWRSRGFSSANRTLYAMARRSKMEQVSYSLRESGTRWSDQSGIWDDIAMKSARMQAFSETGAASAMYEHRAADLEEFVRRFRPVQGQVGAAFLIGGRLAGIELFGSTEVFAKLLPKLMRSYGLDAVDRDGRVERPVNGSNPDPKALLNELLKGQAERHKAVGMGEDIRLEAEKMIGAALFNGADLVHLSAFERADA
jgi:hypothetical protein